MGDRSQVFFFLPSGNGRWWCVTCSLDSLGQDADVFPDKKSPRFDANDHTKTEPRGHIERFGGFYVPHVFAVVRGV